LRNIIAATQYVHDHVFHFYHLHGFDWMDVVSALSADAAEAGKLQRSLSDWPQNSPEHFRSVQQRLQKIVSSSQLGLFANGYWGHPAYRLPPEANLVLAAHYLEALDFQRELVKIHALLGGKNPHPQTYLVGGMSVLLDKSSSGVINPARIGQMKTLAEQGLRFIKQVYLPDVGLIARHYREWASLGGGVANYLSLGDFPLDDSGATPTRLLPAGVLQGRNLQAAPVAADPQRILEEVARSWYTYDASAPAGLHPSQGQTTPRYTGPQPPFDSLDTTGKYSFLKAPRYDGQAVEVGPLARMAIAYAAGQPRVRQLLKDYLGQMGLESGALFSTLGRIIARAVETQLLAEQLTPWLDQLLANINAGQCTASNIEKWNPSTWPAGAVGFGLVEAPRGALGHWTRIAGGKIEHYQMVMPTGWNASPRDGAGKRGPLEEALVGLAVADPNRPLELLRTIHSFDPCMACAVHLLDAREQSIAAMGNSLMRG
jgi:Ni,Fe-hydrogenase I large subunit